MTKMIISCMVLVSLICSGCVSDTQSDYLPVTEESYMVKSEITDDEWLMMLVFVLSPQLSYLLFFLACFCYFLGDALFGPFGMAAAMYVVYKIGIYRFELNEDISQITVKKNNVIYSIDWNYSFAYPEKDAFIFMASPKKSTQSVKTIGSSDVRRIFNCPFLYSSMT